jgi:hypothetical protein
MKARRRAANAVRVTTIVASAPRAGDATGLESSKSEVGRWRGL